ncbi:MAG: hypothetical protein ACREP7_10180 [Lysobacter sp.]
MNWKNIATHTAALAAALFFSGVLTGLFSDSTPGAIVAFACGGYLASFIIGAVIFAHLAIRQSEKTVLHAVIVLVLSQLLQILLSALIEHWLPFEIPPYPVVLQAMGFVTDIAAAIVGTVVGIRNSGARWFGPVSNAGPE